MRSTKVILTTERLILRTWQQQDVPAIAAISADPQVMRYFPQIQSLKQTQAFIEHIQQHYDKYGYSLYAVELKESGEFIGFVGLNEVDYEIPGFQPLSRSVIEIGWRLSAAHWGKGYATEAAKAVLDYAFTELALQEIVSFTAEINLPSRRVMEKIGLHYDADNDFDNPKVDKASPLCRHVLYHLTRQQYINHD